MKATISVLREESGIEYEFQVEVTLDKDGDLEAKCAEDVPGFYLEPDQETGWQKIPSHSLFAYEGQDIELTAEEALEGMKAIASNMESYNNQLNQLLYGR